MRIRLLANWKGLAVMFRRGLGSAGEDWFVLGIWGVHLPERVGTMKLLKHQSTPVLIKEATELYSLIYDVECYGPKDIIRLELLMSELRKRGLEAKENVNVRFVQTDKPKAVSSESYATEVRRER